MADGPQRPEGRVNVLSSLNAAIGGLSLAKELSSITPARAVFGVVSVLLTMIRDTMANEQEYVDLGLSCADICKALDRGMDGKKLNDLSKSVCDAINQLTTTVEEMQRKIIKQSKKDRISQFIHSKNDKDMIAGWKLDLNRILVVFNTELTMSTHTIVADIHQNVLKTHEVIDGQHRAIQNSISGDSPPPPPRACFGRDELIKKIVGFAELLTPIALIGAGGIGKTAVVLTTLHHDCIGQRFGEDRRFIRCDQFPPSPAHFLRRLSKAVGAGIENPADLASLRTFLSSKEMLVVLDNAESVLDLQGTDGEELYNIVDELSQFNNICLCITSRISTVPTDCETFEIPTLSMDAAYDTFYRIYRHSERSGPINSILEQLDFHPLSLTLLATVAQHSKRDAGRLVVEWGRQRTGVLHAQHSRSLATAIELSLASSMFRELGPDARELLGAVAFFPQGVNEKNIDWLFPAMSDGPNMLDKFCILSLAYRSDGSITMLAPLRDYLRPQDPTSSPLLNTARERYFAKLSVDIYPGKPGFVESRWITSEDVNVEHLLDVFTSIDGDSQHVWDACFGFLEHLRWHKPRLVVLGSKIEGLPDNHPSKPQCLHSLSWLFDSVGNLVERKRLLTHALQFWKERGDDSRAAQALCDLSDTHRLMNLFEEGIQQAREASETFERLGDTIKHAASLIDIAWLLCADHQLDAAEEAASRAIDLLPEKGEQLQLCWGHRVLGTVCKSKREAEKAIHHFEVALGIGSSLNLVGQLFWVHYSLAQLFSGEGRFDDARAHVEHTKSHAANSYFLARVSLLRAEVGEDQHTFEEARSEALHALDAFEKLGAGEDAEFTRDLLRRVGGNNQVTPGIGKSDDDGGAAESE